MKMCVFKSIIISITSCMSNFFSIFNIGSQILRIYHDICMSRIPLNHKICISYILQIITKYRFTLWTMLSYTPWFLWHVWNIDLYPIHCFIKHGVLNTRNWIHDQSLVIGKVYYMSHWSFCKMLQWFQRKEFLLISYFFF